MGTLNKIPKTGTFGTAVDAMNDNFTLIEQSLAEGYSPYQVWLDQGNEGTEQDFLDSLKGNPGTYIDPANTEIFDNISDLERKTAAQKEAMIPDGNAVESVVFGERHLFDTSSQPVLNFWLYTDKWLAATQTTANRRSILIPVYPKQRIKLIGGGVASTNYAILTNRFIQDQQSASYATGWGRMGIAADGVAEFTVPSDGSALYILTRNDTSQDIMPTVYMSEPILSYELGKITLTNYAYCNAAISDDTWLNLYDRGGRFIPCKDGDVFRISAINYNTTFAFLKDNLWRIRDAINFATGASRVTIYSHATTLVTAPADAKFLFVTVYISSFDSTPKVERISQSEYNMLARKSDIGCELMGNAKVVSDAQYLYAFLPQIFEQNNHIKGVFAANKTKTDGDATVNDNILVLADYDPMTDEWTNSEMPNFTAFVDSDGNVLSGITRAYNNCIFAPYNNDVAMFGVMGDGMSAGYSWGYKHTFASTTYTRCHLLYDGNEVEFSSANYRQMLYDKGWMTSVVSATRPSVDCTAIYQVGSTYYAVFCTYARNGENTPLPLVLLSTTDFATWTVVERLGTAVHRASEIRCVVHNGKVYVVYRAFNTSNNTNGSNGYVFGIYQLDGTTIYEYEVRSGILSLPMCFEVNGKVWAAHNETPNIYGRPSELSYPYGRQQMAFYRFTDNDCEYQFSIENPSGLNYPTSATVHTLTGKHDDMARTEVSHLDRIYFAWSEDIRNLNYRQINNAALADMTSIFGERDF